MRVWPYWAPAVGLAGALVRLLVVVLVWTILHQWRTSRR